MNRSGRTFSGNRKFSRHKHKSARLVCLVPNVVPSRRLEIGLAYTVTVAKGLEIGVARQFIFLSADVSVPIQNDLAEQDLGCASIPVL